MRKSNCDKSVPRIVRGNDFKLLIQLREFVVDASGNRKERDLQLGEVTGVSVTKWDGTAIDNTENAVYAYKRLGDTSSVLVTFGGGTGAPALANGIYGVEVVGTRIDGSDFRFCKRPGCGFVIVESTDEGYVPSDTVMTYAVDGAVGVGSSSGGASGKSILEDNNIIVEEDGLYQIKDMDIYPISHPDLSTQPSILPERFGNLPIYEVLIAHGREDEIPIDATVIGAFSFNGDKCVPAVVGKKRIATTIKTLRNKLVCEESLPTLNPEANLHFIANFGLNEELLRDYFRIELEAYGMPTWCHVELDVSGIYIISPRGGSPLGRMYIDDDGMGVRLVAYSRADDFEYNDGVYDEEEGPEVTKWDIANSEGFTPDFTLIRYFGSSDNNYYQNTL